jgi:hypothetical protein
MKIAESVGVDYLGGRKIFCNFTAEYNLEAT